MGSLFSEGTLVSVVRVRVQAARHPATQGQRDALERTRGASRLRAPLSGARPRRTRLRQLPAILEPKESRPKPIELFTTLMTYIPVPVLQRRNDDDTVTVQNEGRWSTGWIR